MSKSPHGNVRIEDALAIASRRSDIASFMVMDVMQAAAKREAAGAHVIHMEVGQPGTPAPLSARKALVDAMSCEPLGYTLALGETRLRKRIAQHYRETYNVDLPYERVVVTIGSSGAFVLAFLALFDVGARVGLPVPGYPCYRHILSALGQVPVGLRVGDDTRFMPTADMVGDAATRDGGLDGLLIASPANPTGTMLEPDRLHEVADVCRKHGIWFISDEIYHGLAYGQQADTALRHSDQCVVINSFSKYYSMTGWRVGWMVVPEQLVRCVERLQQNLFISPPASSQAAALGAFDAVDELNANRDVYACNRMLLLEGLREAGFKRIVPADGAFYLYCDVSAFCDDSAVFARQMLEEADIAATPGLDFDAEQGHRYVRFSYAGKTDDMAEAVRRLKGWPRLVRRSSK